MTKYKKQAVVSAVTEAYCSGAPASILRGICDKLLSDDLKTLNKEQTNVLLEQFTLQEKANNNKDLTSARADIIKELMYEKK